MAVGVALAIHMLSKSQTWTLDAGQTAHLECEFIADEFNLFDNPIIWRKRQHLRRRRTDSAAAVTEPGSRGLASAAGPGGGPGEKTNPDEDDQDNEEEETQINMMGNLVEPFISAQRFRPTFRNQRGTSYIFGLTISSKHDYTVVRRNVAVFIRLYSLTLADLNRFLHCVSEKKLGILTTAIMVQ